MPSPNSSLILREVKGSKLTIAEMDGDLLYLAQTLSSSDGTGVIQVTGSSFDASNTNLTGSGLSLLTITNVAQTNVLSYNSTTGQVYYVNTGSIGRLPAPSNTFIQYNSGSDFGADSSFRFIYTSQSLQQGFGVIALGGYSHAEGRLTTALGDYSHAEGTSSLASGSFSHAEGYLTTASGDYSHAEGYQTLASGTASHAEGRETVASGDYSHAEGRQTLASGEYSHAKGIKTTASGDYSIALGGYTIASGSFQSVIGQWNVANTSQSAFIIGDGTNSSNRHNVLFVSKSHFEVSASNTFLQGLSDTAQSNVLTYNPTTGQVYYTASDNVGGATPPAPSDTYIQYNSGSSFGADSSFKFIYTSQSLQQGNGVTAFGFYSHAEGSSSLASGTASHAEGYRTTASGDYSHAEGRETVASGYASHAKGIKTTASGDYSIALGGYTIASGSFQSVVGQFNVSSTSQSAFIIGDGTNNNARHNVLFVSQSHFEADAPNTYFKSLSNDNQPNILAYNSSTGKLSYAVSSSLIVTNALTASYVTASNVVGTVTSASYAATASFTTNMRASSASVANFVPAGGGDYISNQIFFSPQFPNNNYAITVTGEDARSWTIQSKESASFVINTNSSVALSGPVYWIAMQFNS